MSEATSGQMPTTSETPSSVEGSSGCNISEATSGQNAHNIRDAIERGGEQRRKNSRGFFGAYAHATVRGDSNSASVGDFSECRIWTHVHARVGKGARGAALTRPL